MIIIKNNKIGTCALCGVPNVELQESHLIPKLAYTRTKINKKSRFRALNDIKRPLQDGEKKKMLCRNCEKLFSAYETKFTNCFLDEYLNIKIIKKNLLNEQWFLNYILSVSWRILYDDLYNYNSFNNHYCRNVFEEFEVKARNYFKSQQTNAKVLYPPCKHFVYRINDLINDDLIIKKLEPCLFGYCYYDGEYQIPIIYTYYLGLIFVTTFEENNLVYFNTIKKMIFRKFCFRKVIKKIITNELMLEANQISIMYNDNMTIELYDKIKKYYNK